MIKTQGVLHFTIPVKDLDRSEKFYKEILGMQRVRRNDHMVFMQAGEDNFVLTYSENPIDPNRENKHDIHSAFRVTPEEYDRAKKFRKGTFQGRSAYFHDPDRNVIEIMDLQRGPVPEGE